MPWKQSSQISRGSSRSSSNSSTFPDSFSTIEKESGNVLLLLLLREDPRDICELCFQGIFCLRGRNLDHDIGHHRGREDHHGETEEPEGSHVLLLIGLTGGNEQRVPEHYTLW